MSFSFDVRQSTLVKIFLQLTNEEGLQEIFCMKPMFLLILGSCSGILPFMKRTWYRNDAK
ncbi:hypothetical protein DCO45_14370 [Comamonas sp. JNW]|nr:hypothetical protein DCO45_14370 [Comamonas sp. JNW]